MDYVLRNAANIRAGEVGVVESAASCASDDQRVRDHVCSTEWSTSAGIFRPTDPLGAPCDNEMSAYTLQGRRPMKGVYARCSFQLIQTDVPNDDLGVIANFRDAVKALKVQPGSLVTKSQDFNSTNTFDFSDTPAYAVGVGVWLNFRFQYALTQALIVRIRTVGFKDLYTRTTSVDRDVKIRFNQGCIVAPVFVPFASPEFGSNIWATRGAFTEGEEVDVIVEGLPTGTGNVDATFLSPNNPILEEIAGALNNA